jgi:hypothetical protein
LTACLARFCADLIFATELFRLCWYSTARGIARAKEPRIIRAPAGLVKWPRAAGAYPS